MATQRITSIPLAAAANVLQRVIMVTPATLLLMKFVRIAVARMIKRIKPIPLT